MDIVDKLISIHRRLTKKILFLEICDLNHKQKTEYTKLKRKEEKLSKRIFKLIDYPF